VKSVDLDRSRSTIEPRQGRIVHSIAAAERVEASGADALVRRAALGEAAAFDLLVASRVDRCHRLAFSILANQADAADATQEGFISAWRQLPRLRDLSSFDSWLNRIVANAARMSRRHRVRLREVQVVSPDDRASRTADPDRADPAAGRQIDGVASADALGRAFDRLREQDRMILVLHHLEERPLAEIARTLGIPVGTTKWRLHRARQALEHAMEVEA
jgi:RNA polymerase sigma-70 factor (ECF subfamily)